MKLENMLPSEGGAGHAGHEHRQIAEPNAQTMTQEHSDRIAQRWRELETRLPEKLAHLRVADRGNEERLLQQATVATTSSKRIHWLRHAAAAATARASTTAACRRGCSACCRISVVISEAEASLIAKETGVKINRAAGRFSVSQTQDIDEAKAQVAAQYRGKPCTFLQDETCSIHASRPLVCRWLINLDDDELLCQLVDGEDVRVPYLDMRYHEYSAALILGAHQRYDDIRAWFPQISSA